MNPLRIHLLQHDPAEGLGSISEWIASRRHSLTETHLYRGETPPAIDLVDWVILMGGPMNVYEYRLHPWLRAEKEWLAEAIQRRKLVLGICLGAQLIADTLGAKVYQNREQEIGWFPIRLAEVPEKARWFGNNASEFTTFHWHGDTFDLPAGSVGLASSAGCAHQAFSYGDRVVGLQFHAETIPATVEAMVKESADSLGEGRYIQNAKEIVAHRSHFETNREILWTLLNALEGR